ncbi:MAG TPA: hypothetical protein VGD56_22760 [Gemmatirosa sp.]
MRVSPVARVVRISAVAAVVVAPMLAACSNDPLAPTSPASRVSASAAKKDSALAANSGGSVPWFQASSSGGSVPWF